MPRKKYPLAPDDPAWIRLDKMLAESDAYYAEHPDELEAAIAAEEAAINWPHGEFARMQAEIDSLKAQLAALTKRLDDADGGK